MATEMEVWLEQLGLGRWTPVFEANDISPEILLELSDADLRELGVDSLGARKRVLAAIRDGNVPQRQNDVVRASHAPPPRDVLDGDTVFGGSVAVASEQTDFTSGATLYVAQTGPGAQKPGAEDFDTADTTFEATPQSAGVDTSASPGPGPTLSSGEVLADRYYLVKELGGGAMGVVYRAIDQYTQSDVAVKVLNPRAAEDPLLTAALIREASLSHQVSHTNLLRVHSFERLPRPFLVMELVEGESLLERWLIRGRVLPFLEAAPIAIAILDALAVLHARDLLHRDIKPANVLLSRQGEVKLADFGVASSRLEQSRTQDIFGTPLYMSPEQLRGAPCDGRSDLYALGLTLYQLLQGELPFPVEPPDVVRQWHLGPHRPLPKLATPWAPVIAKAIAYDPEDRFRDALHMREALREAIEREQERLARAHREQEERAQEQARQAEENRRGEEVRRSMISKVRHVTDSLLTKPATLLSVLGVSNEPSDVREAVLGAVLCVGCTPRAFVMGSPLGEPGRLENETEYAAELSMSFAIARYPVPQALYEAVLGENPSGHVGATLPVENISWFDALRFCNALSERLGLPLAYQLKGQGRMAFVDPACSFEPAGFRLPTEAEWEFACRAGTRTAFSSGACTAPTGRDSALAQVGWFDQNSGGQSQPVGQLAPNAWGLHDMHGNVWEWCWDYHGSYPAGYAKNPRGAKSGVNRVTRGGSFSSVAAAARSAHRRMGVGPVVRIIDLGFRLARTLPDG